MGTGSSRAALTMAALAGAALSAWTRSAAAHGFGERFDLPLPLWLWVSGAGATIVVTFLIVGLFMRGVPRATARSFDLSRSALGRALTGAISVQLLRIVFVLLFLLCLASGFLGDQDPYNNLIVVTVWVVWWVGVAFVAALVGDVWAVANPLETLFRWAEAAYLHFTGGRPLALSLAYPPALGVWPGLVLFAIFAWAELLWSAKDVPANLAAAVLAYALVTWFGMFLFGRQVWRESGEAFAIAFAVFARFAPLFYQDGAVRLRMYGAGLRDGSSVSVSSMLFVLLMLATVTFDGFLETPLFQGLVAAVYRHETLVAWIYQASLFGLKDVVLIKTATLLVFPVAFVAAFLLASWGMVALTGPASIGQGASVGKTARAFVMTLVPIAVAYHLAHYAPLLLTAGQFFIPLISDPFGVGWDVLGTAGYQVDIGLVGPYVLWYGTTLLIVVGHIVAVWIAHAVAVRMFGTARAALVSQLPMVLLMVAYTMLSLWILAQPMVG